MMDLAYSLADQNAATGKSIGIYNFARHAAGRLARAPEIERMTVFSNTAVTPGLDLPKGITVQDHSSAIRGKAGRILWDQWGVYRAAKKTGHAWLFLPKGFLSFAARPPCCTAAYVHDIMGEYYHRHYRGYEPRLEYEYFARCLRSTMRHARVVFTNTEYSRGQILDLARQWNIPAPNVVVAGYGFDAPARVKVEKQNRVLLFASKVPHKRTDIAIRFLDEWVKKTGFAGQIDCIGIISETMPRPQSPAWNWIGRVPPERGREFIRRSRAVVYVSENEGFGMPPVEAVLEGTCPVYSDIPPIREAMGGAGHAFGNGAPKDFIAAMERALATPSEVISGWSAQLLERHNWGAVTRRIIDGLAGAA